MFQKGMYKERGWSAGFRQRWNIGEGEKGAIGKKTQVTMCMYHSQVFGKNGVPGDIAQKRESKSLAL